MSARPSHAARLAPSASVGAQPAGGELRASVDELNAVLADTPFLKPYGFRVRSCVPGGCVLHLPFARELERPGGIVSGMTLMGAADVAMWLAIMTLRGVDEHWVTSDMKTAFLRSARAVDVACSAAVLKLGLRSAYGTAECASEHSGLLAHHVITYAKASREP
jgi:acyl-coenzyme A thioesterase PaaI-like protein